LHAHPHLSKEGFGAGLTPSPFPLGLGGGPKTLKAEGNIFENWLQNKRCLAGCKINPGSTGYLSYSYIILLKKCRKIHIRATYLNQNGLHLMM